MYGSFGKLPMYRSSTCNLRLAVTVLPQMGVLVVYAVLLVPVHVHPTQFLLFDAQGVVLGEVLDDRLVDGVAWRGMHLYLVHDLCHAGVVRELAFPSVFIGVLPEGEELSVRDELLEPRHCGQAEGLALRPLGVGELVDKVDHALSDLLR